MVDAVNDGLAMLKRCAPFVVVFNEKFSRIDIKTPNETTSFEVTKRSQLSQVRLQKIKVLENENNKVYLMAKSEKTDVAIPLESMDDSQVCLPVDHIPKLFYGIPIVGTENFSFPAVINSFEFTPTEERDGVYVGQADDDANHENQAAIEEACELLVELLRFAGLSGWRNIHLLADVPAIQSRKWLNTDWLRECLKEHLIKKNRQTPAIVTETDQAIALKDATLPLAENIKDLWNLLEGLKGQREKLPKREEAAGWYNAIKSWAAVSGNEPESLFSETMHGRKLASYIDEQTRKGNTYGKIEDLQGLLREDVSAVEWLNQLHHFLNENELRDVGSEYHIVIDQDGFLNQLSNLHCDRGIDEELKDIAKLLDWSIRQELRDPRLTSLAEEAGLGNWENKDVIGDLINKLRERVDKNPDDNFKEASARLFTWIVDQKDWSRLQGFPAFTKEGNPVRDLSTARSGEPLLAPVDAWQEGLEQFADLFPPDRILADDFKVCAPEAWEQLDKQDLIRKSMIITRNETDLKELSPDVNQENSHETAHCITVTDIVEREAIMRRVRDSQDRAFLFWRFLTDWLIKEHDQGLEIQETLCTCKETHKYYSAAWLMPVRKNEWIRPKGSSVRVEPNAQSLANLLRDNEWEPGSLSKNSTATKLLKAIGVNPSDLNLYLITKNDAERNELVNSMTELHHVTQGNLNQIRALVQHLKEDQERKHIVHENQRLGQQVEDWVQASLEQEGFSVRRTGTGSDFEISDNTDDMITLDIARGSKNWLIEVKATRAQSVRMSSKQAQTAVEKKGEFLLCIVPIGSENTEPDLETVRGNMCFIKNIHEKLGSRVATLCESIEEQEEVLANTPDDTSSGVDLDFEAGKAGVRVANSVWEDEGFQLENLAEKLK